MAILKGTNSYLSLDEANTYLSDRLDVAAWQTASDEAKCQALVTATRVLDSLDWTGYVIDEKQPLAFPRIGSYKDPKVGYDVQLGAIVPKRITEATADLAYHLLNNDGLMDDTGGLRDLNVSSISLVGITTANLIPRDVSRKIQPLLLNNGSRSWWRNN